MRNRPFLRLIFGSMLAAAALQAQTYRQILADVDRSLALKSAEQLEKAASMMAEAAKGRNLPSLDAHLSAAYLKDTPLLYIDVPPNPIVPAGRAAFPMGTKEQWRGDITLSYPLFTGFAVTAAVDKAAFEAQIARLKRLDLKRNLYLQATRLFSAVTASEAILKAREKGLEAIEAAYKKAKGLYDNGLLPPADLYNIEAKKYAMEAQITETRSQMRQLLNRLSWLIDTPVSDVEPPAAAAAAPHKGPILRTALRAREDIRALSTALHADAADETLAKSRFYPTLGIGAAVKKQGNTLALNGDGYTNGDRSYVGAEASWNLFSGFADRHRLEAARAKTLAARLQLNDYKKRVAMELENAFARLGALQSKLLSAKMEVKAQQEYYKLTEGRFENQLASADELSRAIADLAAARAKKAALESEIFAQQAAIHLMAGLENFEKSYRLTSGPHR